MILFLSRINPVWPPAPSDFPGTPATNISPYLISFSDICFKICPLLPNSNNVSVFPLEYF